MLRREQPVIPSFGRNDDGSLAKLEGLFDRFSKPSAQGGRRGRLEPVDHDLDLMLDLAVECEVVGQVDDLAVDPGSHIACAGQLGEQVFVFALLPAHDRGQHQKRRTGR